MNESTIHITGDSRDAQSAFDRVLEDVNDLRAESGRATDALITDSSRLARLQIQDSERALRARSRLLTQQVRDETAIRLRAIRGNSSLSAQERRAQAQALRDIAQDRIRAFTAERDQNLERLRNARTSLQSIATEERMLASLRRRLSADFGRQLNDITNRYRRIGTVVAGLGGVGIFGAGRFFINAATEVDRIRQTLQALGLTAAEVATEFGRIERLSRLPAISFQGAGDALLALRGINVQGGRAVRIVGDLGNALALVGGTDLQGVIRAFTRISNEGKVLDEDLDQLVDRIRLLGPELRREFGSVRAEGIRETLEAQGQDVEDFISRLEGILRRLPRASATSATNTFQNFSNAVRQLSAQIGELALPRLTEQIRQLTDTIQRNSDALSQRFAAGIRIVLNATQALITNFGDLFRSASRLLAARVLVDISGVFSTMAQSARAAAASTALVASSTTGFSAIFSRAGGAIGLLSQALSRLTVAGAAIFGAFAIFDFIKFIRGAGDATNAVRELTDRLNTMGVAALDANESLSLVGTGHDPRIAALTRRLQGLQHQAIDITDEFIRLRREFRVPAAQSLQALQQEIERRREVTRSLGGNANLLRIQTQQLDRVNALLELQKSTDEEILEIRKQITSQGSEDEDTKRKIVELTQAQVSAEQELFAHRLRLLGLQNRQEQRERERTSEEDLQFQERVAERQVAIANDGAARAAQIRRQNINNARVQAEQSSQEQLQHLRNLGTNIAQTFRNINISLVRESRDAANSIVNEFERASEAFTDLQNRIERGVERRRESIQRAFDAAARQTPEQQSIVDDFVGAGDADNLNRRLRGLYDGVLQERERLARGVEEVARIEVQRQVSLIENLSDTLFNFAFDRDRTFRETAITFVRESLRIILQSTFETNLIIANNNRIAASYAQVGASRDAAFASANIPGIGNLPGLNLGGLGNFATGGAGALGIAGLLFPQEFNNLVQGIGRTVNGLLEAVGDIPNAIGNITVDNTIALDDGTIRAMNNRSRSINSNRRR